jgi:DNA-binding IclR family transcriptional regulator
MTPRELVPYMEQKNSNSTASDSIGAPALSRGLQLLEILDAAPQPLNLTQLSAALQSPKNSTSRLIQTLIEHEYVVRDETTMLIRLTGKLLRMGQPRLREVSLVECSLESMRGLRDAAGETVQIGIPSGDAGIIIEQVMSTRAVRIGVDLGLRFGLHNNAPGKVLLAYRAPKERERTIGRIKLERFTDRTITDKQRLREECDLVVQQGYSTDWGEADEGIHCVAAPIRDRSNSLIAVIWVSGIAGRMPKTVFSSVAVHVVQAAQEIERRLRL